MDKRLKRILPRVQKPARYTGGEYHEIIKNKAEVDLRVAFCFPDVYEIGMSNVGMRILYSTMNALPGVWCERVFAPWDDMEREMRAAGVPLYALESGDPVSEFDAVAFSLGYEMAYTAVLNMLDLAGIPLHAAERTALLPLVFAGGTSCCNPAPMADFLDLMILGEGEEVDNELLVLLQQAKREGWTKPRFLRAAADIPGIYVPSLYDTAENPDGTLAAALGADVIGAGFHLRSGVRRAGHKTAQRHGRQVIQIVAAVGDFFPRVVVLGHKTAQERRLFAYVLVYVGDF